MKKSPKIVVLEGLDNSGKTTQAKVLKDHFSKKQKKVFISKELTTEIGTLIKKSRNSDLLTPVLKTFLFAADRERRIAEIEKMDHDFDIIIFDRYIHSAIAYRSADKDLDINWVKKVNECFAPPHFGFYIDITPEVSIQRNNSEKENILYSLESLKIIRETYIDCVEDGELTLIDGMVSEDKVTEDLISHMEKVL